MRGGAYNKRKRLLAKRYASERKKIFHVRTMRRRMRSRRRAYEHVRKEINRRNENKKEIVRWTRRVGQTCRSQCFRNDEQEQGKQGRIFEKKLRR